MKKPDPKWVQAIESEILWSKKNLRPDDSVRTKLAAWKAFRDGVKAGRRIESEWRRWLVKKVKR